MSWSEVLAASALEQAAMVRARKVSSVELVALYLDRIARIDPSLSAFVSCFSRRARIEAHLKDAQVRRGEALPLFHGVPIGIKDLNLVRGSVTRFGSRAALPLLSPFDDHTTASLRRGGFVILGKLSASEMGAMPVTEPDTHPPTRNPWSLDHTAGGSSGGSGAAVAADLLPIAQGSDGAGSIRIPSAFCHLYGLKPSRGRVANSFGRPDREVLYTCGPIARTVRDAAAMLDVLAGLDRNRPHWALAPSRPFRELLDARPRRMTLRMCTRAPLGETDPEIKEAVERAAQTLRDLGHEVEEAPMPAGTLEEFLPLWQKLVAEFPMARWDRAQPITRWLADAGRTLDPSAVRERWRTLSDRMARGFDSADLWLTPTVSVPAPKVGAFAHRPPAEAFADAARLGAFTAAFNVTGQPAASLPLGLTRAGLPMGLQLAGRPLAEADVLAVSCQLEEAMPWRSRRAPLATATP